MGAADSKPSPDLAEKCNLPPEAVKKLMKAFKQHTKKGPTIWRQDFYAVMQAFPKELSGGSILFDHIDVLFDILDTNQSGTVDLEELLMGLSILTSGSIEEKAKFAFQAMDADNSGSLDKGEIKKQMEKLYKMLLTVTCSKVRSIIFRRYGNWIQDKDLRLAMETALQSTKQLLLEDCADDLFNKGDIDGDDSLSMEEWLTLIKNNETAQWIVSPDTFIEKKLEHFLPALVEMMPKPQ